MHRWWVIKPFLSKMDEFGSNLTEIKMNITLNILLTQSWNIKATLSSDEGYRMILFLAHSVLYIAHTCCNSFCSKIEFPQIDEGWWGRFSKIKQNKPYMM